MTTPNEAMRLALEALEQVRKRADSANGICHLYEGDCPAPDQPDARDAGCPACKTIDASDAAITALRAALAAAPQPPAAQQGEAVSIRSGMCQRCGKWAGAHATLPGQPTDHLCRCQPTAAPQPAAQGDRRDKIIADLRSAHDRAVAQIEQLTTKIAAMSAAAPAGVVGEPVASIYITPDGDREMDDWRHDLPVGRNILYTAPPARQALTDEQVDEEWFEVHHLPINNVAKARLFARAIERAHGIGGKGETA